MGVGRESQHRWTWLQSISIYGSDYSGSGAAHFIQRESSHPKSRIEKHIIRQVAALLMCPQQIILQGSWQAEELITPRGKLCPSSLGLGKGFHGRFCLLSLSSCGETGGESSPQLLTVFYDKNYGNCLDFLHN